MNKRLCLAFVAVAVLIMDPACHAFSGNKKVRSYTAQRAEQVRQLAVKAFMEHKIEKSYRLFGDYCKFYPGSSNELKSNIDSSFQELKSDAHSNPLR